MPTFARGCYQLLPVLLGLPLGIIGGLPAEAQAQLPNGSNPAGAPTTQTAPAGNLPTDVQTVNPSQFPTVSTGYAASSYLLGPGDQIELSVYGYEEYTGPMMVLPDGGIILPLVGKVPAAGRTTEQLAQQLTGLLSSVLVDPQVSVTLNTLRPVVVNVSGEVYRPGPTQLQTANATDPQAGTAPPLPPSISTALVQAGGITRTADIREVVVLRALPNGQTARTTVNLWDALWSESLPQDLLLRDGDLVYVPRLAEGEVADSRLLARSSLSPETVRVRVVGEVTRPGEVPVPPNSSLSSAVAIAGGPTNDAKLSEVAFIRMNDAGEVQQEVVDLSTLVDNYQVQDGDVVVVPKTSTSSVLDFAQRLLGPLGFIFNVFQ